MMERRQPCPCLTNRKGALLVGVADLVVGLAGLSLLLLLDNASRRSLLQPFSSTSPFYYHDLINLDTQFIIEYTLPSLIVTLIGLSLLASVITKNHCISVFSFMLSTVFVAGSLTAVVALCFLKSSLFGVVPFALFTLIQLYFYSVVLEWTRPYWDRLSLAEDKQFLVQDF